MFVARYRHTGGTSLNMQGILEDGMNRWAASNAECFEPGPKPSPSQWSRCLSPMSRSPQDNPISFESDRKAVTPSQMKPTRCGWNKIASLLDCNGLQARILSYSFLHGVYMRSGSKAFCIILQQLELKDL